MSLLCLDLLGELISWIESNESDNIEFKGNSLCIMTPINGKGYGLIARNDIKAYTIIMHDYCDLFEMNNNVDINLIMKQFNGIDKFKQRIILNLCNPCYKKNDDMCTRIKDIYNNNSIAIQVCLCVVNVIV